MLRAVRKNLCLLFKYLGDVAVAIPAMRALKASRPEEALHVLVAEDAVPIVRHLPWATRVWGLPRKRGRLQLSATLPLIAALRREQFDLSVDFVGNDRGALLSRLIGATERVGLVADLGFWGRARCYTRGIPERDIPSVDVHESDRHLALLSGLGVPQDSTRALEVHANPALAREAAALLPSGMVLAHLSTSQPKKEWPVRFWRELYRRALSARIPFVFASGPSAREQSLLSHLREIEPDAPLLPKVENLDLYLAVLARAGVFISGDTGPLHFAAGLGVPTLALFAATDARRWAPLGAIHRRVSGTGCVCSGHAHVCAHASPCISSLSVDSVWSVLRDLFTCRVPVAAHEHSACQPEIQANLFSG
jgi:heptosyltransferase-3